MEETTSKVFRLVRKSSLELCLIVLSWFIISVVGIFKKRLTIGEQKSVASVLEACGVLAPELIVGTLELPCHIISEDHQGFFVRISSTQTLGVFRCQLKWWAYVLENSDLESALAPDNFLLRFLAHSWKVVEIAPYVSPAPEFALKLKALAAMGRTDELKQSLEVQDILAKLANKKVKSYQNFLELLIQGLEAYSNEGVSARVTAGKSNSAVDILGLSIEAKTLPHSTIFVYNESQNLSAEGKWSASLLAEAVGEHAQQALDWGLSIHEDNFEGNGVFDVVINLALLVERARWTKLKTKS